MTKLIKIIMLSLATAGMLFSPPVFAQENLLPADDNTIIDKLQENCDTIRGVLRRLHTTDALLRVNAGQMYNGMSVRLMARLNSRLALNRVDSSNLVEITSQFEASRKEFVSNYSTYETALSNVIKTNCKTNAGKFYELLIIARDQRSKLAESVQDMHTSISDYQVAVEQLYQQMFINDSTEVEEEAASEAS